LTRKKTARWAGWGFGLLLLALPVWAQGVTPDSSTATTLVTFYSTQKFTYKEGVAGYRPFDGNLFDGNEELARLKMGIT
jgi:hypothetical protein